jgi:hypothetical protein
MNIAFVRTQGNVDAEAVNGSIQKRNEQEQKLRCLLIQTIGTQLCNAVRVSEAEASWQEAGVQM